MPTPNPMTRREHRGSASPAQLTASMSPTDTAFSISTNTGWPTGSPGPFFVVIDPGTGSEEKVLCSAQSTSVVTVAGGGRGVDGTIAKSHAIGATVYPVWTAQEADEANAHQAATSDIHGVSGDLPTILANKQPLDAKLTALAAASTATGLVVQTTATGGFLKRVIGSSDSTIVVTNPGGIAANIDLVVNEANFAAIPQNAVTNLPADLGAKALATDVTALTTRVTATELAMTRHIFQAAGVGSLAAATVTGAKKLLIQVWGGGGAGGGCPASGAAPNAAAGGGGGGGGYAEATVTASAVVFPLSVTVGAAGAAVAGAAGGNGGLSSVTDNAGAGTLLCRATGGTGGALSVAAGSTSAYTAVVVGGGTGDVGSLGLVGGTGLPGWRVSDLPHGGMGGAGAMGGPGGGTNSGTSPGLDGRAPGGAGGGGIARASGVAQAGGAGGAGLVIITAIY